MASAAVDDRPLTADMLAAHLAEGCKPESQFRIGAEHEKFVFRLGSHAPVPYEPAGIKALLEGLMRIQDKVRGMKGLTKGQPIELPIPSRTGYVQLPPELDDPDPVKALEKQIAFVKMTKEKATPTKA